VAELAETRAELAAMSHRSGVLAERERLAREIHDTLAQGFASVLLLLEAADAESATAERPARDRLEQARRTARDSLAEARALVAGLTPPGLREQSLPAALRQVVDRATEELPEGATLAVRGAPRALPAGQEVVLLRALQEALSNIRKHAHATTVRVELEYGRPRITLRVTDNGRGFDLAHCSGGFGLAGLRRRVAEAGGSVAVQSGPGSGTTLSVDVGP
jgi:signal transduction histidine kinase